MAVSDDENKLSKVVAEARRASDQREQKLTVHHRDHNHDNNPADGSNWELLCLYCHDNEHQRQLEAQQARAGEERRAGARHNPFADLKSLINKNEE